MSLKQNQQNPQCDGDCLCLLLRPGNVIPRGVNAQVKRPGRTRSSSRRARDSQPFWGRPSFSSPLPFTLLRIHASFVPPPSPHEGPTKGQFSEGFAKATIIKEVIGLLITFISHRFYSCPECIVIHEMVSKPEEKNIYSMTCIKTQYYPFTSIELVKETFP